MRNSKVLLTLLLCWILITAVTVSALTEQKTTATDLTASAGRLIAALSPNQRKQVQMDYAVPGRSGWQRTNARSSLKQVSTGDPLQAP